MRNRSWCLALIVTLLVACGPAPAPTPTAVPATASPRPATPTQAPPTASSVPSTASPTSAPTADPIRTALDAPLSNVSYRVPLITRHAAQHEAVFEFELDQAAKGRLLVVPDSTAASEVDIAFDGLGGLFTAQGLEPDIRYHAAVVLETDQGESQPAFRGSKWGAVTFATQPDAPKPFRVAVVGDSGFGEPITAQLGALMATYDVDFTVHTGDLVYRLQDDPSPAAGFQTKLFAPFATLLRSAPFYPILGNHDLEQAAYSQGEPYGLKAFMPFVDPAIPDVEAGAGGWYAFSQHGIQFVVLNSQVVFGYPGKADETAWLAERLADPRFNATIVVLHVPIYNAGYHMLDSLMVRRTWGEMIQAANVPLVLAGHDHNYQRFEVSGKTYIISGGGSGHLYQVRGRDPALMASAVATHFVLLTFTASTIQIQAIDVAGQILDEAEIPWDGWSTSGAAVPTLGLAAAPLEQMVSRIP